MNILLDSAPEAIGGLVATGLAGVCAWVKKARAARRSVGTAVRRYTVLNVVDTVGLPIVHSTTCPVGVIVKVHLGAGHMERVKLTDAVLPDGTYAAEAIDRF
ncbi:hypothetical protein ACFWFU_24400 [Streptomyces sp. NPDC060235]|uniref:hypothetical protein n=1 Tax=Streptomyces sp. NPDC060235 TaxID=3347080 RepID=UPI0036659C3D